jgi:hypothetical protein
MTTGKSLCRIALAVALGVSTFGCAMRIGDFTVGSSKNIGLLSNKGDTVTGEDCSTNILGIPVAGPMMPNFKTAVDKALERAKGDVVADVVLSSYQLFTLVYNQACYKVEGKVARAEFGKK